MSETRRGVPPQESETDPLEPLFSSEIDAIADGSVRDQLRQEVREMVRTTRKRMELIKSMSPGQPMDLGQQVRQTVEARGKELADAALYAVYASLMKAQGIEEKKILDLKTFASSSPRRLHTHVSYFRLIREKGILPGDRVVDGAGKEAEVVRVMPDCLLRIKTDDGETKLVSPKGYEKI